MAILLVITGCSSSSRPNRNDVAYTINSSLITVNNATMLGKISEAGKLSSRLFPGVFIDGPHGEQIANPEIALVTQDPGDSTRANYAINQSAKFSDGAQLTCTDFLMTHVAAQNPRSFGSYLPLWEEVDRLECEPGSLNFSLVFKPGFGSRYKDFFNAGTVLPSNFIAQRAGIQDLADALLNQTNDGLIALGKSWQESFLITQDSPEAIPTLGPYLIDGKGKDGELQLSPNPKWSGDAPQIPYISVYPGNMKVEELTQSGELVALEMLTGSEDEAIAQSQQNNYEYGFGQSRRIDHLSINDNGVVNTPEKRKALSLCIDRPHLAQIVSDFMTFPVLPAWGSLIPPTDPGFADSQQVRPVNCDDLKKELEGQSFSVAYNAEVGRYAQMINALNSSLSPAGVTLIPRPVDVKNLQESRDILTDADMILLPLSPDYAFPEASLPEDPSIELRKKEQDTLFDSSEDIPLTAEPYGWIVNQSIHNLVPNPGNYGYGWNMDRWTYRESITSPEQD